MYELRDASAAFDKKVASLLENHACVTQSMSCVPWCRIAALLAGHLFHRRSSIAPRGRKRVTPVSYDTEYVSKCKGSKCTVTCSCGGGDDGWSGVDVATSQSHQEILKAVHLTHHSSRPMTRCSKPWLKQSTGGNDAFVFSARLLRRVFSFFFVFANCGSHVRGLTHHSRTLVSEAHNLKQPQSQYGSQLFVGGGFGQQASG